MSCLAACEGIADFFFGSLSPEDPPAHAFIIIEPASAGTATGALTASTTPGLVEVQAGGIGNLDAYIAVHVIGGVAHAIGVEPGADLCLHLPDENIGGVDARLMSLAIESNSTAAVLMVALATPEGRTATTDAADAGDAGDAATDPDASDAGASPDADSSDAAAPSTALAADADDEAIEKIGQVICGGMRIRAVRSRVLSPLPAVDAGRAASTDGAVDAPADGPADATTDVIADAPEGG